MVARTEDLGVGTFQLEEEFRIEAPRDAVYAALVHDIGVWWGYRISSGESRIHLEPQIGGRLYEDCAAGGALWGVVTEIRRPEFLRLEGAFGMKSAVRCLCEIRLAEDGPATRLGLRLESFGVIDPAASQAQEAGLKFLLGTCLKRFVEEGLTWDRLASGGA